MTPAGWLGLISDTHGLLRPQALDALRGARAIVHAGDVGNGEILEQLGRLAPVTAVRGNVDRDEPCRHLPETAALPWERYLVYVVHDVDALDLDPAASGFAAVVYGHSHRSEVRRRDGVLFVNPGSAGPRRFRLPVTVARLHPDGGGVRAEIVELPV